MNDWLKNNYYIIIICLISILICIYALYNLGIERENVTNYYKEYINRYCTCQNPQTYIPVIDTRGLINESIT